MSNENPTTNITPQSSSPQSSIPMKTDPSAINHSDSPSTVLITPLLTRDKYGSWSCAVTMVLRAKRLHDCFSTIRSQILLMEPFPSIQRIYNLASKPPSRPSGKRQHPFYEHCNKHGHTLATCYQIHGFPDKQVKKSEPHSSTFATFASQLTPEQYNKLLTLLSKEESGGSSFHLAGLSNKEEHWSG
ncbi:hypothetical protein Q3G72_009702 [Acer saccharum]|nr:hypothetical protein Q3G72_009702 [Acer saccharum]